MIGQLIKDARTAAGLTQERLAFFVGGLTDKDIRKAEREEIFLSNDQLKRIAKVTGVTQKSLLDANKLDKEAASMPVMPPMGGMAPLGGMAPMTGMEPIHLHEHHGMVPPMPHGEPPMELSATEKKLIERYRAADSTTKKAATKILKGECADLVDVIVNGLPFPFNMMGGPGRR